MMVVVNFPRANSANKGLPEFPILVGFVKLLDW